jgi:hypothetical protein
MDFIVFILRKGVVKHDLKLANCDQLEKIFFEATNKLSEFIKLQEGVQYVKLK